jgi:hypothetical protein
MREIRKMYPVLDGKLEGKWDNCHMQRRVGGCGLQSFGFGQQPAADSYEKFNEQPKGRGSYTACRHFGSKQGLLRGVS